MRSSAIVSALGAIVSALGAVVSALGAVVSALGALGAVFVCSFALRATLPVVAFACSSLCE